jgi:hypothetical protein
LPTFSSLVAAAVGGPGRVTKIENNLSPFLPTTYFTFFS